MHAFTCMHVCLRTHTHTQSHNTHPHTHIQIEIRSNEPMLLYDDRDVLLRLFSAGFWKERGADRERTRARDKESQTNIDTETETTKNNQRSAL